MDPTLVDRYFLQHSSSRVLIGKQTGSSKNHRISSVIA